MTTPAHEALADALESALHGGLVVTGGTVDRMLEQLRQNGWELVQRPPLATTPATRSTSPETSHAAARSVADLRPKQHAVLQLLGLYGAVGLTDEQLAVAYDAHHDAERYPRQSPSGLRSRRAELVAAGLVEWTGEHRTMTTGRLARVWRATTPALEQLHHHDDTSSSSGGCADSSLLAWGAHLLEDGEQQTLLD